MFFLQYSLLPDDTHPEHGRFGESLVLCWVKRRTLAAADRVARQHLRAEGWQVVQRDHGEPTSEADCPREEWLPYFQQALIDGEVYVFNVCPRYPVFCVTLPVSRGCPAESAEALYFVSGESMLEGDEDIYDPTFWSAARRREIERSAAELVGADGWRVVGPPTHRPIGRSDLVEDFHGYYDEAEDEGACLVFVHGEAGADGGRP